jgi:hypothetical protein
MVQKERTRTVREPLGNVCVIRDDSLNGWTVRICTGVIGDQTELGKFSTRGEAESFAQAELQKLNSRPGEKRYLLHVDDCPCWQKEL